MRKPIYTLLSILFLFANIFGQTENTIDSLTARYNSFDYNGAVDVANDLIAAKQNFTDDELISIYVIKGIAHYSLGQLESAKISFTQILNIDASYSLDPINISPKIVAFYNNIKDNYSPSVIPVEPIDITARADTVIKVDTVFIKPDYSPISGSIVKSIILPGWGHISTGDNTKGWLLTSASLAALGSMVYFIFDTDSKRDSYLNEIDQSLIEAKYDKFNTSYKIRNTLIITYAAIWLYSQLDLLIFSGDSLMPELRPGSNFSLKDIPSEIQLDFTFPL
jgi:tetratricopeptide (TPR) repeat protein